MTRRAGWSLDVQRDETRWRRRRRRRALEQEQRATEGSDARVRTRRTSTSTSIVVVMQRRGPCGQVLRQCHLHKSPHAKGRYSSPSPPPLTRFGIPLIPYPSRSVNTHTAGRCHLSHPDSHPIHPVPSIHSISLHPSPSPASSWTYRHRPASNASARLPARPTLKVSPGPVPIKARAKSTTTTTPTLPPHPPTLIVLDHPTTTPTSIHPSIHPPTHPQRSLVEHPHSFTPTTLVSVPTPLPLVHSSSTWTPCRLNNSCGGRDTAPSPLPVTRCGNGSST